MSSLFLHWTSYNDRALWSLFYSSFRRINRGGILLRTHQPSPCSIASWIGKKWDLLHEGMHVLLRSCTALALVLRRRSSRNSVCGKVCLLVHLCATVPGRVLHLVPGTVEYWWTLPGFWGLLNAWYACIHAVELCSASWVMARIRLATA